MVEIRPLLPSDDRSLFRCGQPELDYFFKAYAGQNQFKHHIGSTYVALLAGELQGFVTVSACHLFRQSLPGAAPRTLPDYPLPALRIARLAIDERCQRSGIGLALLRFSLGLALSMKAQVGCVGVIVDAKEEAVGFYSRFGFTPVDVAEGEAFRKPVTLFLSIKKIVAASRP